MSLRALPRIYRLPQDSFFLFGLRGVGKSTWIGEQLPDAHRFDLLDEGLYQGLLADPAPFAGELRRLDPGGWVVVDEVQRLPGLLNEVHRFIEERGLRFALLGSSARKLRAAGVNLLGGRALWREMFPLTPEELGGDFDLERTLRVGALPLVLGSGSPRRDPARLRPALPARGDQGRGAGAQPCRVRTIPPRRRPLPRPAPQRRRHRPRRRRRANHRRGLPRRPRGHASRPTLAGLRGAPARARAQAPKALLDGPGGRPRGEGGARPGRAGGGRSLLEGWVHTLLRTYMAERELADEIAYWAPAESKRLEVDFVLRRGAELCALEVKAARRIHPGDMAGLRAIGELPGLRRRILIHRGDRPTRTEDGIDAWPIETFLEALEEDGLWR